jgi:hypothetical protein
VRLLRDHLERFGAGPGRRVFSGRGAAPSPNGPISTYFIRPGKRRSARQPQAARSCTGPMTCAMPQCRPGSTPEYPLPRSPSGQGTAWTCRRVCTRSASLASTAKPYAASNKRCDITKAKISRDRRGTAVQPGAVANFDTYLAQPAADNRRCPHTSAHARASADRQCAREPQFKAQFFADVSGGCGIRTHEETHAPSGFKTRP